MHTRRSARVRAADALRTTTTVNDAQDENNLEQTRKQGTAKKPSTSGKENVLLRHDPPQTKTPLRDVTNDARTTRSRRPRKTVEKPSKRNADECEINNDAERTSAHHKRSTRRKNQRSKPSIRQKESRVAKDLRAESKLVDIDTSSAQDIQPETAGAPSHSQHNEETAPTPPAKSKRVTHGDIEAELETRSTSPSTHEIQPTLPNADSRAEDHESEPSSDEIQPNSPAKKRRIPPLPSKSSHEIQPGPARNERSSADSLAGSRVRSPSPAISDSPPLSPLASNLPIETRQDSWMTENREPSRADLDITRPRQAVYTYGKRRRIARVSLPTMQALGVRAKSPSSESQSGSEKEGDENLSDAYAESEDENDESPKRNPKLQAFVTEQKKLWAEVDDIDLLVESD